ncbi:MAG: sensor domain-containing diguanylate cyclase [Acholeplasmataceae bacterium]|nr:sensor domain-containing diguanylate cyclase [Acholeplasmataceae bacterium]
MLEQLKKYFDHFHEAVYIVDPNRKILYYNPIAEKISGFTKEEMEGSYCFDNKLNHIDEKGKKLCFDGCPLQQSIRENIVTDNMVYLQHKKGHRIIVHVKAIPLIENGEIIGAIEVFTDQTKKPLAYDNEKINAILKYVDPLTGLLNRLFMKYELQKFLDKRDLQEWGIIFLDLDSFKRTNDTYGHLVGDQVLSSVANTILNFLEEEDFAFRFGGDEMIVMFSKATKESLIKKAQVLQALINATKIRDIDDDNLTNISMGLTVMKNNSKISDIIDIADQAMYEAKKEGINLIRFIENK